MHHYFITGTSRGLGEALAYALLSPQNQLYCVSRSGNAALEQAAESSACKLKYQQADLSDTQEATKHIRAWLSQLDSSTAQSVCLIHNAASLNPIGLVGQSDDDLAWQIACQLNYLAPVLMSNEMVAQLRDWGIAKKILIISSGAARSPRAGWAAYCSTKAGLEMYARVLSEEQKEQPYPVKVVSLAPGVIDTAMQDLIRQQPASRFPSVRRFIQLKEEGQLWSTTETAHRIRNLLGANYFGEDVTLDLRDI